MSKYNLTKNQLGGLYDITKMTITIEGVPYNFNSLTKEGLILTNEDGTDLTITLNDIKKMLHKEMVDSPTSEQSVGNGSMSNTSLDTSIFKSSKNKNNRDDGTSTMESVDMKNTPLSATSEMSNKKGGYDDATSSMNPAMFRNASLSTTSDMPNNQRGGYDATSSMNPTMFKNVSLSMTSDMVNNQRGGYDESSIQQNMFVNNLLEESSMMSSTLDLSEVSGLSNKNNNYIFNTSNNMNGGSNNSKDQTLNLIRKKLQEIGVSSQQEFSYTQKGGNNIQNKKILSKKTLSEIGINSSSTSDFCH
jgi:hypothetical protein